VIVMTSARYGRMRVGGRCAKHDYGFVGCWSRGGDALRMGR